MKVSALLFLSVVAAAPALGQPAMRVTVRPTVRLMRVMMTDVSAADSATIESALLVALRADSTVEVLETPLVPAGQPVRGARFVVTGVAQTRGEVVMLSFRTFNTENSEILDRSSTRARLPDLADSVTAAGRRIAQSIAATRR
jgi:hypothetical protein